MKFVFWWDSPCKGMIGVLREFCRLEPDTVVLTGKTGKRREAMGWMNQPCLFPQHVIMDYQSAEEWNSVQCRELQKYSGCFHVVNGLVRKTFRPLLSEILRQNLPFATMTEAPCNMMDGIKRPLKEIYMSRWLPLVHRPFATRAEAFLCLSGEKEQDLRKITHLGFPREKIYPFGYFTDEDPSFQYRKCDDRIHLLCPGLLAPYKGVDLLVCAVAMLKKQNISNFVCHITGEGQMKNRLHRMISREKLDDVVILHGVLKEEEYCRLVEHIDILVAPGRNEPWGIRVNEAIQRGQAVIVSDKLGASTLIEKSGGGAVFHSGSVFDLCTKLKPFLCSSQSLTMAKKSNLIYKEQISCVVAAKRLHEILLPVKERIEGK